MTTLAMRPIAFSYVDMSIHEFNQLKQSTSSFTSKDSIEKIFNGQVFIGIVALKDPLREGVKESIDFAKKGGVTVRLISGDNLDTAKAYAVDCGILSKQKLEQGIDQEDPFQYCMDSKQFREKIGGITKDKTTSFMRPKN